VRKRETAERGGKAVEHAASMRRGRRRRKPVLWKLDSACKHNLVCRRASARRRTQEPCLDKARAWRAPAVRRRRVSAKSGVGQWESARSVTESANRSGQSVRRWPVATTT